MCNCRVILFSLILVLQWYGCNKNSSNSDETFKNNNNTIVNADFERSVDFNDENSVWKKQCYEINNAKFEWLKGEGHNKTNCVSIASENDDNDLALTQDILLEKDKVYQLTAWVKTDNVIGGKGANICLFGTWQSSEPLTGTHSWQKIAFTFLSPESGEVTIACRLGFWNGTSSGKAWFDDIQIREVEMFDQQSQHIRLRLKKEDVSVIQRSTITNWLANLDKVYVKYYELIGTYPYKGRPITIFSVDTYPGGWAVAGNPILWHQPYVQSTLLDIENKGDWSFGILHEIGHDFAPNIGIEGNGNWNWNEEMFANFRMYYAVELLNASVIQDKVYTGNELKNYYKTYASGSYENKIRKGETKDAHDGVMYTLIRVKDEIGWEPFKRTFQYLYQTNTTLSSNWQKFELFLDKLTEFSGKDVRQIYPDGELDIIKKTLDDL